MTVHPHGRVRGSSIELDAPVPQLEGQRVLVVAEDEDVPSAAEQRVAWEQSVQRGVDGPIEDEGET